MIGDSGVGKSSLVQRYSKNQVSSNHKPTVGVDWVIRDAEVQGTPIKVCLWDTAGQEKYNAITGSYFRASHGAILVYDVSSEDSFTHIQDWLTHLQKYTEPTCIKMLIGNKSDVPIRYVPTDRAINFAQDHELTFLETSALNDMNVSSAFDYLIGKIHESGKVRGQNFQKARMEPPKDGGRKCCTLM
uniref:Uncharacterized protein n=1 Tax=Arcella intermedia TaxID=1963864 RepID=A0A6B2LJP4_9EUKA